HIPMARKLGHYLVTQQKDTGAFVSERLFRSKQALDYESPYYPGEAILALLRLHRLDPQLTWLEAARRGAAYLIEVRDAGIPEQSLPHDHWLLYALNELHRASPDRVYLEHAMRIVRTIQAAQNLDPLFPDYHGSFFDPPRSTPVATRSEGLSAAHALAFDF